MSRIDNYQKTIKFTIVTPPAGEPVTLTDLKDHLRVDSSFDDAVLTALGKASRELVEAHTARRLMPRVETLWLDSFPPQDRIIIPAAPVSAVASVKYYDQNDVEYVFDPANYTVDTNGPIAQVVLKFGVIWPTLGSLARKTNTIGVQFSSGYTDAPSVPSSLALAVKILAGHLFENREATTPITVNELPFGLRHILAPHRVWEAII